MTLPANQLQADRNLHFADWNDFRFQPVIERGGEFYELPRPITRFAFSDTWDSERFKTLLVDGDTVVGPTRNGVDIHLTGEIASPPGTTLWTPAEMFAALAELRANLHVGVDDDKYRFYLYRDVEAEIYRYFQACTTSRLETDLTNAAVFQYRLVIHADDPQIYDSVGS